MTDDTRITLEQFIAKHRITATAARVDRNPNMEGAGRAPAFKDTPVDMDHWRVTLRRPGAKLTVYFSKGFGHEGKPAEANEVLNSLALDSSGVENASGFADWCGEYGYDTDSRKAHKTYKICERQMERLLKFLGTEAYDELLWHTEGL